MFQSRRIASGSPRWHAPSACSPSSASVISNSMPSRMRRATFLMTLESSTTKQLFITLRSFEPCFPNCCSCGQGTVPDVQHAVDVEHHHELSLEPIDPGGDPRQARIEIGGLCLACAVAKRHHLADGVDQEAIGFALELDA